MVVDESHLLIYVETMTSYSCTKKSPPRPYAYILLVDQPQGYKPNLKTEEYLRTYTAALPTVFVPKGSLVEFDPLCPVESGMKSITVISLDETEVKAPVMLRELRPLEPQEYELLRPLNPQVLVIIFYLKKKTSFIGIRSVIFFSILGTLRPNKQRNLEQNP